MTTSGPGGDTSPRDGYEAMAEFHDLFMDGAWERLRPAVGDELGHLTAGSVVADLGAGTGLGTMCLVELTGADVWALEPSPTMRTVLLHRVAADPGAARRVSVVAGRIPESLSELPASVDGVVLTHMLGHLDPAHRAALVGWIGSALQPGGRALVTVQEPTPDTDAAESVEEVRLGAHTYRAVHSGDARSYRSRYDVLDAGSTIVRSLTVSGTWEPVGRKELLVLSGAAGLCLRPVQPGLVALERHDAPPSAG